MNTIESKHDSEYYGDKAIEMYNDITKWSDILFWEEVVKNPLYDEEARNYTLSEEEHDRILYNIIMKNAPQNTNAPKCPTCQSLNIRKLTAAKRITHGLAFGLFSKTARSQWVCDNCGNKW